MTNKKGVLPVVVVFYTLFAVVGAVAVWHIPAWTKVKHDRVNPPAITGNSGNFVGGSSN